MFLHTLVRKAKVSRYNQHKIVTFDTLIYHIAFKTNGDHCNAPQKNTFKAVLENSNPILHPSVIMCYQGFYSLISCKAKNPN